MHAVDRVVGLREPASMSILERVPGHEMVVMAATTERSDATELLDDVADAVLSEAHCTVLALQSRRRAIFPFPLANRSRMANEESTA
jgi:nucleotide-binding universal stress UspA family protein